jgi:hypothetical protein
MKGWDKDRQRALFQPSLQVLALALVQGGRPLWTDGAGLGAQALYYLPGSLLGTWWGTDYLQAAQRQAIRDVAQLAADPVRHHARIVSLSGTRTVNTLSTIRRPISADVITDSG